MATDATVPNGHASVGTEEGFDKATKQEQVRTCKIQGEDGKVYEGGLPPLENIVLPETTTKSALIRWCHELGYSVGEISKGLGIRYQMVRNITTTVPKRAAREDLPALIVTYRPETDEIQDALDGALDQSLMASRRERMDPGDAHVDVQVSGSDVPGDDR